jgi:hypothetical protein
MIFIKPEDFLNDETFADTGKPYIIHVMTVVCLISFNLIYTDHRIRVQKYSGYFLLIYFSYGGQCIFYTEKQDKYPLVFVVIFFSLLVAIYVRICQKVIENMFR